MESRPAVNYGMLQMNVGKLVSVIGKILDINPSGNQIKLLMSDGKDVLVTLKNNLTESLKGFVQITAMVEKDGTLTAEHIITFLDGEIDLKKYNEAVQLAARYKDIFSYTEPASLSY